MVENTPPTGGQSDRFARWLAGLQALYGAIIQAQALVKNQERSQKLRGREINISDNKQKCNLIMDKNR